jgi:hypothetical protein
MNAKKVFWCTVGVLAAVLLVAAVATPNLLRSRLAADEALHFSKIQTFLTQDSAIGQTQASEGRNLIRKVALELVVANVDAASTDLRRLAVKYHGFVDHVQFRQVAGSASGELQLRVPADQLDATLAEFKKSVVKVEHEEVVANDVSHEWIDNDARMHNLKASEQQYLEIMKRARSIKEVLDVTEKLNDVRGNIEQLQVEMNVMQHDVAMSAISIVLVPQSADPGLLAGWHPLLSAKSASNSLISGVSAWCDFMIGVFIIAPAVLLWGGTIFAVAYLLYWILKLASKRYGKSASAATPAA